MESSNFIYLFIYLTNICPRGQGTLVVFSCLVSLDEIWKIWKFFKVQNTAKNQAICLNMAKINLNPFKYGELGGFFPQNILSMSVSPIFFSCHHVAKFHHKKTLLPSIS
jgi:hypothetical protein